MENKTTVRYHDASIRMAENKDNASIREDTDKGNSSVSGDTAQYRRCAEQCSGFYKVQYKFPYDPEIHLLWSLHRKNENL